MYWVCFTLYSILNTQYYFVVSGPDNIFWQKLSRKFNNPKIIFTGYVAELELVTLYKNAVCFIMPSLEEGFGIPILEAMSCSCPVLCSNKGSLPEVAGKAALYFDPTDQKDLEEKVLEAIRNNTLRKKLIINGIKRYQQFSWSKMAQTTLTAYEKIGI